MRPRVGEATGAGEALQIRLLVTAGRDSGWRAELRSRPLGEPATLPFLRSHLTEQGAHHHTDDDGIGAFTVTETRSFSVTWCLMKL